MEVRELMIGNWIYGTLGVEMVVELDHLNHMEANPEGYKPIPLTEEWLVDKFGLKKERIKGYDDDWGQWWTIGYRFLFEYDGKKGEYYNGVIGIQIKTVHQLMNLYFALTGKELEVKS